MKNSFKKPLILALAVLLLFTGCASTTKSNKDSKKKDNSKNKTEFELSEDSYSNSKGDTAGIRGEYSAEYMTNDAYGEMEYEMPSVNGDTTPLDIPNGAMLIRTMNITADTADFPGLEALVNSAVKNNGGYFESMNVSGTGTDKDYRHGRYVIRVPSDKLDTLVASLEGNITVTYRSETTEDVTLEYVDVKSRIDSLRIQLDCLTEMLEDARDMETIVYLQSEISSVRYQIESYESQARVMENQVTYSTLYLNLNEVVEEVKEEKIETKREKTLGNEMSDTWSETVANMKENAKNALLWFISALPYIILSCIIILIIIIVVVVRRKKNNNKNAKQTTPENIENTKVEDKKE